MPDIFEPLDVTQIPGLAAIVNDVSQSNRPRVLRLHDRDVAILIPVSENVGGDAAKSAEAESAGMAAAGSWEGLVDPQDLKRQIRSARGSDRETLPL